MTYGIIAGITPILVLINSLIITHALTQSADAQPFRSMMIVERLMPLDRAESLMYAFPKEIPQKSCPSKIVGGMDDYETLDDNRYATP